MVALSLSLSRFVMGRGRNEKGRNGREVLREEGEKRGKWKKGRGKEKVACVRERRKKREKEKKNGKEKVIVQRGEKGEKRRKGKEKEKKGKDMCNCVSGWEKTRQSYSSQPCDATWWNSFFLIKASNYYKLQ
jgi:hypothetical protein